MLVYSGSVSVSAPPALTVAVFGGVPSSVLKTSCTVAPWPRPRPPKMFILQGYINATCPVYRMVSNTLQNV